MNNNNNETQFFNPKNIFRISGKHVFNLQEKADERIIDYADKLMLKIAEDLVDDQVMRCLEHHYQHAKKMGYKREFLFTVLWSSNNSASAFTVRNSADNFKLNTGQQKILHKRVKRLDMVYDFWLSKQPFFKKLVLKIRNYFRK